MVAGGRAEYMKTALNKEQYSSCMGTLSGVLQTRRTGLL